MRSLLAVAIALVGCGDNVHLGGGQLLVSPEVGLRTNEAGGTALFTVSLTNEPLDTIVVELRSMNPAEGTVEPSELTFTPLDFFEPKTVTIAGVDDDRADGNQPFIVRAEADSPRLAPIDLEIVNDDDDTAGFAVSPVIGLMTSETGVQAQFTVHLLSEPTSTVAVPVASSDPGEGTPDQDTLTFNVANWAIPQTVIVSGQPDSVADGNVSYAVMLGAATTTDSNYAGIDPDDVQLFNVDANTRGIAVSTTGPLATTEGGVQDTFSVVLQTQPTSAVTIDVSSSDSGEASVSTPALVFTPQNWSTPQTVTVTGANDFMVDGSQPFTIVLGDAASTDPAYAGATVDDVTGANADDDTASVVVTPTASLMTSESGASDAFTVALTSQPSAPVTIAVASSDPTEGTASTAQLTFTAANWNQAQTVRIAGIDDPLADGDQPYRVTLAPATSGDALYAGVDPNDVSVMNIDNDTVGFIVDPATGLVVSEFTDAETFTIALSAAPTANVTIPLSSSDTTEGVVLPTSVTFTPQNWDQPQTITITGVNDNLADGNQLFTIITGPASSADPAYNGADPPDVEVTNIDNDTAQVYVKSRRRLLVSEGGQSATFRVRLTVAPTATVTCTLQSSDPSEGSVSPTSLVFQPNQFGFQTVTVVGADDAVRDGDVAFTIVLNACTSADPAYSGVNPRDVAVTNRDND